MITGKDTTDGAKAEALAARFLTRQGLTLLERNYRVRGGEIDLICLHGKTLVFVEVRLRRHHGFGGASASVGRIKQQRLILAASHYLMGRGDVACRFDCILMDRLDEAALEWIPGAFAADV